MRRFVTGLLILVSALTLVLASTSLWTRRNVVNTQVFVSNVSTVVDLPQVEARITQQVTATVMTNPQVQDAIDAAVAALPDRLQRFKPSVEDGVRSLVAAGVSRLLTSDPFRPLTTAAVTSAHDQLINGQPVRFTLGQAKNLVPASLQDGLAGQVLGLLPNDVGFTILTPADAPQVYNAINLLKSVWWWLGLIALATFAGALGVSRRRRATLRAWAVTTTVLVLLVLATLRVARGQVVAAARPENRDAVGAIYDVFAGDLRSWTLWLLVGVLVVLVLALVWGRLGIVAGIRRGVAAGRAQLQERRAARARAAEAATAEAATADGAAAGELATPVPEESWSQRVTAWARGFADGLDLPERTARLGVLVRDRFGPARWAGIAVGAVVLLFWPAPTLSVVVWIGALVALYLGALEWLRNRAPEPEAAPASGAVAVSGNGSPGTTALVPAPRLPEPSSVRTPDGGQPVDAPPSPADSPPSMPPPPPLVPAELTPDAIATLNDRLDLLTRLSAARDSGVLTVEEFSAQKERLLGV